MTASVENPLSFSFSHGFAKGVPAFIERFGYRVDLPEADRHDALRRALEVKSLKEIMMILDWYKNAVSDKGKEIIEFDKKVLEMMWRELQ